MHQAAVVQYARPEIIGLVLGAFIISVATKEYKSMAGSSPMIRFILGIVIMIGSLVFLGCPLRMIIRMLAGDLNAWVALIGFVLGIATGVLALKKGFSLGRAHETNKSSGAVLPILMAGVLILLTCTSLLKFSESGQGSSDSAVTVLGLFVGAALCHNFGLASSGTSLNPETKELVAGAVTTNGKVALIICIAACFVIAFTNKREAAK